MSNIAIVGAGLIGRLAALQLHRAGYQVTLFDKDSKQGHLSAARAAAGLLTPLGESMHCSKQIVAMGLEAMSLWPELLNTLDGYTFYQQQGSLVVSHQGDVGDYHRFYRHLNEHYNEQSFYQLTKSQLSELEPQLARNFERALFLPDEGQIGNRKLMKALHHQLDYEDIDWRTEQRVNAINGRIIEVESSRYSFDLVIDCRGTGAMTSTALNQRKIHDPSLQRGLRAVRGELFQLIAPQVNITRPIRLMHPRYQLYIAPKGKDHYVIGATEIESEDFGPVTVRSALELLSAAYSVHPGFAEAHIREQVSQCRPAYADNEPKLTIHNDELIQVNGLYRHGFLIAPVILKQLLSVVGQLNRDKVQSTASLKQYYPNLIQQEDQK